MPVSTDISPFRHRSRVPITTSLRTRQQTVRSPRAAGPRSLRRTKRGSAHVADHDEWARARQGRSDGADAVLPSRYGRLATRSPYDAECDRSKPGDDECGADREEEFEYESRRKQTFSERLTLGESFAHFQEQEQKELRGHKPCQEGQPEGTKGPRELLALLHLVASGPSKSTTRRTRIVCRMMGMDARHVYSRPACAYSPGSSTQFAIQCPQSALSKMPRAHNSHLDLGAMPIASSVSGEQSKVVKTARRARCTRWRLVLSTPYATRRDLTQPDTPVIGVSPLTCGFPNNC